MNDQTVDNLVRHPQADQPTGRRIWVWMLLGLSGLTAAIIWWSLYAHNGDAAGWDMTSPFASLIDAYCPTGLRSLAHKAAKVYLSPWLYLLMAAVFLAEKAIPAVKRQPVFSVGMIHDFLGWFVLGGLVRVTILGLFVSGLYGFSEHYLAGLRVEAVALWPTPLVAALAVLMGDLLNWLHHYIRHKIGVLWLFHTIHHSQKQMNMFTDLRVHLAEYVVTKPITIFPLFVLGLDLRLAFWLTLVLESYTRIYHANLKTSYGPLRYVLVTPQSHRIHHSIEPKHADKNFAVLFSFWDRLFGTQWPVYDEYPQTGVDDARFPHEQSVGGLGVVTNYLRQLLYPFTVIGTHVWGRQAQSQEAPQAKHPRKAPPEETNP